MAYKRTVWENGVTPINAANLNNIEEGIEEAKNDVRSIEAGGTNADNAADARQNINFIGLNIIAATEDDTPENWATLGTGTVQYDTGGLITDQPSTYGALENIVVNNDVVQIWHKLGSAPDPIYYRVGYSGGWRHSWVKLFDENSMIPISNIGIMKDSGSFTCGVSGSTSTTKTVSFNKTFPAPPIVKVDFQGTSGYSAYQYGHLNVGIAEVTTTGFTVRVWNATSDRTPGFKWDAIYIPE